MGVLALLHEHDGLTIGAFGQARAIDPPTVTGIVTRLEQCGLVERRHDLEDRRVVKVHLIGEGRDIMRFLPAAVAEFNDLMAQGISEDEQRDFLAKLQKIIANLTAARPGVADRFGLLPDFLRLDQSEGGTAEQFSGGDSTAKRKEMHHGQGDTIQHSPGSRSPSAGTGPAIDVHDLCKQFGELVTVDDLSLRVEQGEIFGLLGPNGSGKTTTINMISGLSVPSSGRVLVMGYDVQQDAQEIRKLLGAAPQETALYEEISAQANLSFHADVFGIPRRQKQARIDAVLDLVRLQSRRNDRVRTYSGGMKRRLALGRALLHDPQLIYLDEPTLGVWTPTLIILSIYMQ